MESSGSAGRQLVCSSQLFHFAEKGIPASFGQWDLTAIFQFNVRARTLLQPVDSVQINKVRVVHPEKAFAKFLFKLFQVAGRDQGLSVTEIEGGIVSIRFEWLQGQSQSDNRLVIRLQSRVQPPLGVICQISAQL